MNLDLLASPAPQTTSSMRMTTFGPIRARTAWRMAIDKFVVLFETLPEIARHECETPDFLGSKSTLRKHRKR